MKIAFFVLAAVSLVAVFFVAHPRAAFVVCVMSCAAMVLCREIEDVG